MRDFTEQEVERFKSKLKLDPATGCLNWTGCTQKPGKRNQLPYAIVRCRGVQLHGHRLAMMMKLNGPIPHGFHVLHGCHNATCCNIDHLRLGTPKDNADDRVAAGRNGRHAVPGACITDDQVREWHAAGLTAAQIRNEHGHGHHTIRAAFIRLGLPEPYRRPRTLVSDDAIRNAFGVGRTHKERAKIAGISSTAMRERTIALGLRDAVIQTRLTDEEARRIHAAGHRSYRAIERASGRSRITIKAAFARLGLPGPPEDKGGRSIPGDDYWRDLHAQEFTSLKEINRRFGHDARTVRREFRRLGLSIPIGTKGRKPNPINPTKGA